MVSTLNFYDPFNIFIEAFISEIHQHPIISDIQKLYHIGKTILHRNFWYALNYFILTNFMNQIWKILLHTKLYSTQVLKL